MKRFCILVSLVLVLTSSACSSGQVSSPTLTATPTVTQTPTLTPTPTATPTPTNTSTVTSTPTPMAGGGRVYLLAHQNLFDKNLEVDFGYFSLNPDGSGLTTEDNLPISESPAVRPARFSGSKIVRLFTSPDNSTVYWASGDWCNTMGLCNVHYYRANLDGSEAEEIWQNVKGTATSIYLSPSGKYITYPTFFTVGRIDLKRDGCYTASIDGGNITRVADEYTRGCVWAPTDDRLFFSHGEGLEANYHETYYVLSMDDGTIKQIPDIQTPRCDQAAWLSPSMILLSECLDSPTYSKDKNTAVGPRRVDIEKSTVNVYPATGFCSPPVLSPDHRWAIFALCDEDIFRRSPLPPQLIDLESGAMKPFLPGLIPADYIASGDYYGYYWLP